MAVVPEDGIPLYIPASLEDEVKLSATDTYERIKVLLAQGFGVLVTENIKGVGDRISLTTFRGGKEVLA